MSEVQELQKHLIDRIQSIQDEDLLKSIGHLLESTKIEEIVTLTKEQEEVLRRSEEDIKAGRTISQVFLPKNNWLYLAKINKSSIQYLQETLIPAKSTFCHVKDNILVATFDNSIVTTSIEYGQISQYKVFKKPKWLIPNSLIVHDDIIIIANSNPDYLKSISHKNTSKSKKSGLFILNTIDASKVFLDFSSEQSREEIDIHLLSLVENRIQLIENSSTGSSKILSFCLSRKAPFLSMKETLSPHRFLDYGIFEKHFRKFIPVADYEFYWIIVPDHDLLYDHVLLGYSKGEYNLEFGVSFTISAIKERTDDLLPTNWSDVHVNYDEFGDGVILIACREFGIGIIDVMDTAVHDQGIESFIDQATLINPWNEKAIEIRDNPADNDSVIIIFETEDTKTRLYKSIVVGIYDLMELRNEILFPDEYEIQPQHINHRDLICEACGEYPCLCSDREQTSTTHEF